MSAPRRLGLALAFLALASCGTLTGVETPAPPPAQTPEGGSEAPAPEPEAEAEARRLPKAPLQDLEQLLHYFQYLTKLSGPELVREHDNARRDYAAAPSDYNRVRLAMVLSVPNAPFHDEARALELLNPAAKHQGQALNGLAFLLTTHLRERRKLDGSIQSLQQSVQDLQHKLDALKSLERSMIERDQGPVKKR